jgi:predicted polyphosphate/ATP-dependent NAD kinase
LTIEQAKELEEMGVSRLILAGGPGTREALAAMDHYRDTIISKFQ